MIYIKCLLVLSSMMSVSLGNVEDITERLLKMKDPFSLYVSHYEKSYENEEMEAKAKDAFLDNLEYIKSHNSKKDSSYTLGVNDIADMSFMDFVVKYTNKIEKSEDSEYDFVYDDIAPSDDSDTHYFSSIDYRTFGCVSPVVDQGTCSSCWSFSAAAALEGSWCKEFKQLYTLSTQQLIDCDTGSFGCRGGTMNNAFAYVRRNGGLCQAREYPYLGRTTPCRSSCAKAANLTKYGRVKSDNTIANVLSLYGPVSVAIRSASRDLQLYQAGIFDGKCGVTLDHAVVIIGYTSNYWIIKNSWGSRWGEVGYIKFKRQNGISGTCGVNEDASFAVPARVAGDAPSREQLADRDAFRLDIPRGYPIFSDFDEKIEID